MEKQPVTTPLTLGNLYRQISKAHRMGLIMGYRFEESQYLGYNKGKTIRLTIEFLNSTTNTQKEQVLSYIREKFRVRLVQSPTRSPQIASIILDVASAEGTCYTPQQL